MILDELAAFARKRVAADQAKTPLADIKTQAEAMPKGDFHFEKALAGKDCAFICEVKKASPSKGVIDPVFDFEAIARSYEDAGLCFLPDRAELVPRLGRDLQKGSKDRHPSDDPQGFYSG